MTETKKYIDVLNRGYEGFAPMAIGKDFAKSLQQVQERLELLESLNYDALLVEATSEGGKDYLKKYQSTGAGFEYGLHFMRDRKKLLEMLQPDYGINKIFYRNPKPLPRYSFLITYGIIKDFYRNPKRMFRWAFDEIDKYKKDGVWNDEQWREYRWTLSEIEKGLEVRLRQFATAYDYPLSDDPNSPEPQQIPQELATPEAKTYFDKAIELGLMDNQYNWLRGLQMLACFAREMSLKLDLGKGVNADGIPRISWKPFETLFSVERGKLRLNYNDIQKTGQTPKEVYLIDKVFE